MTHIDTSYHLLIGMLYLFPNDVDVIARAITDELIDKADKNIPNRIITVRKDKPPWLTADIKRMIRKKNRIHKRAKKTNSAPDWTKFRLVRNKCNKLVLNSKTDYFSKLSTKIISETHGGKQYWSLIKSLMKCDSSDSRNIPPLQIDDDLICEDTKKAKIFNDYFCGQSNLDDSNTHLPDIPDTRTDGLNITNAFGKALDDGKEIRVFFCDIIPESHATIQNNNTRISSLFHRVPNKNNPVFEVLLIGNCEFMKSPPENAKTSTSGIVSSLR
ncbi:unnamed protein product [Mytilus edulis]|uniref:Uncharacterized protein n=1 Tax=Mytilus edulis TaxID=6550 RepID=A0A8S3RP81_MYTED|nr:unnamed protein product [Mytilus edulis]